MTTARHALVVGGTSGIGSGIAQALARRGIKVSVAGRSAAKGAAAVEQLRPLSPLEHSFQAVDCCDLSSVKQLAEANAGVDLLVLTSGIATLQGYTPTVDGLDQKLQLHYFSRLYLSMLLAPTMPESALILNVFSAGVHGRYRYYEEDFELKKHYSIRNAADAAGFYNDAGFASLAQEYPQLSITHAAPGFVATEWGREMPWLLRTAVIRPLQALLAKSVDESGETLAQSWLELGPGYHRMDQKGRIIDPNKGAMPTKEEQEVIYAKSKAVLPNL